MDRYSRTLTVFQFDVHEITALLPEARQGN